MKKDLIRLIDSMDEIEKLFHPSGGGGVPSTDAIYDVQEFQDWLQEVNFELQDIYNHTHEDYIWDTLVHIKHKKMNGWNDKKYFAELRSRLKSIRKNIDRYYPNELAEDGLENEVCTQMADKKPKIFISHSSGDVGYVRLIVDLLASMGLNNMQLFCSSVPGYEISIDTNIIDSIWNQFQNQKLHVIFAHSDNYYKSPMCLNEMGAAWVLKNTFTSILLPGFGVEKMKGVVNDQVVAIRLDGEELELKDKLNQLHDKICGEFSLPNMQGILWEQKRDAFINEVRKISTSNTSGTLSEETEIHLAPSRTNGTKHDLKSPDHSIVLSVDAEMLLFTAVKDATGQILKTSSISMDMVIQGGATVIYEGNNRRNIAKWETALEELIRGGFAKQVDKWERCFE